MNLVEGILPGPTPEWKLPEVYWVARYDYQPNWAFDSHVHNFFQLIYVMDGAGTAEIGDREIALARNVCLFMPPYVRHSLRASHNVKLRTIDVKFAVLFDDLAETLKRFSGNLEDNDGAIRPLLDELHHEAVMGGAWHREMCCTLLMYILVIIARKTEGANEGSTVGVTYSYPSDEGMRELLNHIHQHYSNSELSLADLVDVSGYSKSYLEKKFRREMGISIHRYIMRYRVYQAKELLRYSDRPIKEIAFMTGFKTIHHFTRVFSEIESVPPAKWRTFEMRTGRKGVILSPRFVNVDITNVQ